MTMSTRVVTSKYAQSSSATMCSLNSNELLNFGDLGVARAFDGRDTQRADSEVNHGKMAVTQEDVFVAPISASSEFVAILHEQAQSHSELGRGTRYIPFLEIIHTCKCARQAVPPLKSHPKIIMIYTTVQETFFCVFLATTTESQVSAPQESETRPSNRSTKARQQLSGEKGRFEHTMNRSMWRFQSKKCTG